MTSRMASAVLSGVRLIFICAILAETWSAPLGADPLKTVVLIARFWAGERKWDVGSGDDCVDTP